MIIPVSVAASPGCYRWSFFPPFNNTNEVNSFPQVKNNLAALLALCWYWASDGAGSKFFVLLEMGATLFVDIIICGIAPTHISLIFQQT
ncbi:PREDICTED: uncharacterized protein LOC109113970 [Nelumbo nucifera]|uniref:Uncharacterized protein LOC109113970 n=1 Tax=Nelumbo nucifera TaxID=4432 RepID=A0A1U8Q0L1_NELNU|nr:PREDICTED: uncharacterized protein LOC109113970 [Nelumbo nucifera]